MPSWLIHFLLHSTSQHWATQAQDSTANCGFAGTRGVRRIVHEVGHAVENGLTDFLKPRLKAFYFCPQLLEETTMLGCAVQLNMSTIYLHFLAYLTSQRQNSDAQCSIFHRDTRVCCIIHDSLRGSVTARLPNVLIPHSSFHLQSVSPHVHQEPPLSPFRQNQAEREIQNTITAHGEEQGERGRFGGWVVD